MALNIKSDEADRLARELAGLTGESITQAVTESLRQRIASVRANRPDRVERLLQIGRDCAQLPRLDQRAEDEILGYDEHGLPR